MSRISHSFKHPYLWFLEEQKTRDLGGQTLQSEDIVASPWTGVPWYCDSSSLKCSGDHGPPSGRNYKGVGIPASRREGLQHLNTNSKLWASGCGRCSAQHCGREGTARRGPCSREEDFRNIPGPARLCPVLCSFLVPLRSPFTVQRGPF